MSTQIKLIGNMQAAEADLIEGILADRGRGFASAREAWAQEKEIIENAEKMLKSIKDIHKEMWSAVVEKNEDAFCALCSELQRAATRISMEWITASAMAKIAEMEG